MSRSDASRLPPTVRASRRWIGLAFASLVLAGLFAVVIVVARLPGIAEHLRGDPSFFRRCLVVHVDLALVVWFYAFLAGLFALLPHRSDEAGTLRVVHGLGLGLSVAGFALLLSGAGLRHAEPVLSNYVPVIDNALFLMGLVLFAAGIAVPLIASGQLWSRAPRKGIAPGARDPGRPSSAFVDALWLPPAAHLGLRAAAVAFLVALACFAASAVQLSAGLDAAARYEAMMWAGGHVLQFASEAAMVAVWFILLGSALGRSPISERVARWGFGLLLLPLIAAPLVAAMDPLGGFHRVYFTKIMQWGIFPPVLLMLGAVGVRLWRMTRTDGVRIRWSDVRVVAFLVSAMLTIAGFAIGGMIRGESTMVPAHYHASIGAVTVSFMGASYLLLNRFGVPIRGRLARRAATAQPLIYGLGQLAFAIGFGLAGAHGAARKVYGAEQHVRTVQEWIGLTAMGVGGLVAVAGGVLLLAVVGWTLWRHRRARERGSGSRGVVAGGPVGPLAAVVGARGVGSAGAGGRAAEQRLARSGARDTCRSER